MIPHNTGVVLSGLLLLLAKTALPECTETGRKPTTLLKKQYLRLWAQKPPIRKQVCQEITWCLRALVELESGRRVWEKLAP